MPRTPRKDRHLGTDEELLLHLHTHPKALVWPVMALLVLSVALGFGLAQMPASAQPWGTWALLAGCGLVVVVFVLVPVLRWWSNTWTLTSRRVVHRQGILTRTSHDLPLARVNDIASERGLLDRVLGCGTLRLTTAAEDPVLMHDVPDVEQVHLMLSELLHGGAPSPLDARHEPGLRG